MNDISFDAIFRDLNFENNDFQINETPSVQNAAIILESRCGNLLQPQIGIGFNSQVLGGNTAEAAFELNRCVSQILADGALSASWSPIPNPPNVQFDFNLSAQYPS